MFLILFAIVMDYLLIQVLSAACEWIFSFSKETVTMRRNMISSILMEALQMLKYHYKAKGLDFSCCAPVNQWMGMDDPKHFVGAVCTGL